MKPIYLDNNSTTQVDPEVLKAMLPYFSEEYGNAASSTHSYGRNASQAVQSFRETIAAYVGAESSEIIFTSGSTESINFGLKGLFELFSDTGRNKIVTVKTEHKAVLDVCERLKSKGAEIIFLNVDSEGNVDLQELESVMDDKVLMLVMMLANNETGVLHPLAEAAALAKRHQAFVFCDATQAGGKMRIDVNELNVDLLCLSAHKMYGPKGVGALYLRRKNPRVRPLALLDGGGHESGMRSGTLNVPGIAGMAAACLKAQQVYWEESSRISILRNKLEHQLLDFPGLRINGGTKNRLYNTSNICFSGKLNADLIKQLQDIAFSFGSACTSAEAKPSHVLNAMGLSEQDIKSSVRFSLGRFTTEQEINTTIELIRKNVYGK